MDVRKVEKEWNKAAPKIDKMGELAKASILGFAQGYMAAKTAEARRENKKTG